MPPVLDQPIAPSESERSRLSALDARLEQSSADVWGLIDTQGVTIELPESARAGLHQVVHALAQGHAVSVLPADTLLTSQQAATLLNVSRPYLVRLLDQGKIPFSRTGTHRRIKLADLTAYKHERDIKRQETRERLVRLTEELGLYKD
jgi:excisionase family DNA binding protein